MKYRKKPVVVNAVQYLGISEGKPMFSEMPDWLIKAIKNKAIWFSTYGGAYVYILEGEMKVSIDDFVIKGVKGELYPCKPDIFELTHEAV